MEAKITAKNNFCINSFLGSIGIVLQVFYYYPQNEGTKESLEAQDRLLQFYVRSLTLISNLLVKVIP